MTFSLTIFFNKSTSQMSLISYALPVEYEVTVFVTFDAEDV
jgi:peroxiredoxin family protein